MSFIFSIPAPHPVASACLLAHLPGNDIHVLTIGGEPLPERITESALFYRQGASTRGIWLQPSDHNYDIRINTLASKEDYLLAIELAVQVATLTGTGISSENGDNYDTIAGFRAMYHEDWAEQNKMLGFDLVRYMAARNEPVCLHGCFHDFHIGSRYMAALMADAPDDHMLYERVINAFRRMQFPQADNYFVPNIFQATDRNQQQWSYIVLAHDTPTFLKKADYLMLAGPGDEFEEIAFDRISDITNEYFTPIDEYQYFVAPIPAPVFNSMMKKVKQDTATPTPGMLLSAQPQDKKWWQFWK
jgi:hypothetical protein